MRLFVMLALAAQVLWPGVSLAQAPTPTPPIAVPSPLPGNPTNPGDTINNPHPTMPWVGVTTPYGQFLRWVWMPPQPVNSDGQVLYQPGFWVAQTTAGYYYHPRWVLREVAPGTLSWSLISGGAVVPAR